MKQRNKVYLWSLIIAIGGFLFGFDTAVISGAEKAIQQYWALSAVQIGFTVSIALIGTIIGALTGSIPSDRIGRKRTLFAVAILYLLSAVGTALSTNWVIFLCLRFIGGVGVGVSSVIAPIYISELSPAEKRGRLVALFQFNVVFGILIAYISNYLIGYWFQGEIAWRLMLGVLAVPALIFIITIPIIPESPRWLILKRGKTEEASNILSQINPIQVDNIMNSILAHRSSHSLENVSLWSKKYRLPAILAILIAFFNQTSGINAILYYAPRIFEMTGLGTGASLLSSVGVGLINFIFTLVAMSVIDKFGRRKLMLIGSVGLIITLGLVSRAFFLQDFSDKSVMIFLFIYIAFFAVSQGAVIWVFISEIFPTQLRAKGQSLGSFTHWTMAAIIAFTFPYLTNKIGGGETFLFFTCMMVLQLVFVIWLMPETKGRTLEQIDDSFNEKVLKSELDEKVFQ